MSNWTFQTSQNWDKIWSNANIERWLALMEKSNYKSVFSHPSLLKAWADTYLPLRTLHPLLVWAEDETGNEVLLPLVFWHRNWKNAFIKNIIPMGYSDFDYHLPISLHEITDIEEYWSQLIDFIKKNFSFDNMIIDGITDSLKGTGNEWKQNEICPYLKLDHLINEDQLLRFMSTSLRGDIRRQIRRLEEHGGLSLKIYTNTEETIGTFEEFLSEHSSKWPKAYKAPNFHNNLLKAGLENGLVHFSALTINDTPIAWHLGFVYRERFYYYMPIGRKEFSTYSPAKVHLFFLVKWAIDNNFTVFDHLRGEETYKSGWSNGYQHVHSITLDNNSFSSNLKRAILKLRP